MSDPFAPPASFTDVLPVEERILHTQPLPAVTRQWADIVATVLGVLGTVLLFASWRHHVSAQLVVWGVVMLVGLIVGGHFRPYLGSPAGLCVLTIRRLLLLNEKTTPPSVEQTHELQDMEFLLRVEGPEGASLLWGTSDIRVRAGHGMRWSEPMPSIGLHGLRTDLRPLEAGLLHLFAPAPQDDPRVPHPMLDRLSVDAGELLREVIHPGEVIRWCEQPYVGPSPRSISSRVTMWVGLVLTALTVTAYVVANIHGGVLRWGPGILMGIFLARIAYRRGTRRAPRRESGACAIYLVTSLRAVVAQWDDTGRLSVTSIPPHLLQRSSESGPDLVLTPETVSQDAFPLPRDRFVGVQDRDGALDAVARLTGR